MSHIFQFFIRKEELERKPEGDHEHDEEGEEESRGRGLDGPENPESDGLPDGVEVKLVSSDLCQKIK